MRARPVGEQGEPVVVAADEHDLGAPAAQRLRGPLPHHPVPHDDGDVAGLDERAHPAVVADLREHEPGERQRLHAVGQLEHLLPRAHRRRDVPRVVVVHPLHHPDRGEHRLADRQIVHVVPDRFHDADLLIARDHGKRRGVALAERRVAVAPLAAEVRALGAVADPRVRDADDDVARPRIGAGDVPKGDGVGRGEDDGGCLHGRGLGFYLAR